MIAPEAAGPDLQRVKHIGSQWNHHRVMVFGGQFDTHIKTGEDYGTRTLASLFVMEPSDRPKGAGLAFIPSSFNDHNAREHAVQRERGSFVALCGDVDTGDHSLERIEALVREFAGDAAWLIYTSAHARPGDLRWRIVLPLEEAVPHADWHDAQNALFDYLEAAGVKMDRALDRAAQPVYLPNVPATHTKTGTPLRGPDNQPLYYARATTGTNAPGLDLHSGALAEGISRIREQREREDRERERIRAEAERRRASRPRLDDGAIIDEFNRSTTIADLFLRYNYTQCPRNPLDWRSPQQQGESYATRITDDKWISLSASDASAGLGDKFAAGCYGDAYDLFVHYEHGGAHKDAFRALHSERKAAVGEQPKPDPRKKLSAPTSSRAAGGGDGPPCDNGGVSLNDFRAYMPMHSYIFMPTGELWPATSVNSRIRPLLDRGADGSPLLDDKGKPKMVTAATWLDRERPVEQMTWAPGEPKVIEGRLTSDGGWITRPGCSCFNLYRPPIVLVGNPAGAARWLDHVERVYPAEAAHIINWLAHRVQRPHEKINHALVLGGAQGIGKDTLLEPVKAAIGPWNFVEVSPQHMLGRFNGFAKSVILRVSEARDLGDVDRFAFYDHMKTYTAAPPDVLRVDEKNLREYAILNVCGVIITTNHKADGIFLPRDDRRHFVAWSELSRADFPDGYWTDFYSWYQAAGIRDVAAYLRTLDLTGFDAKAPPPKTDGFWTIVDSNRAPEDADMADALDQLSSPDATTLTALAGASKQHFSEWLLDRRNSRKVPHRLEECGYEHVRNTAAKDGLWKFPHGRSAIYGKKSLSVRDRLAAAEALISNTYPRR